jgi:hypothetical protein
MAKSESKVPAAPAADVDKLAEALAAPFDPSEVKFKPQTVSGNRALAVPFVDARVIQDRLDDVLGTRNWQDSYECLPDGAVVCRLRIRLGEEWITKEDVGGQSEQPDEGDRRKAAFSDALKRAAVKYGIGRYLYRLKPQWVDYDPQKRQFVRQPSLPASALPSQPVLGAVTQNETKEAPAEKKAAKAKAPAPRGMPADGLELLRRLTSKDEALSKEGLCKPGELVKQVKAAGVKAGHDADLTTWSAAAIQLAIDEVRAFEAARRQAPPKAA